MCPHSEMAEVRFLVWTEKWVEEFPGLKVVKFCIVTVWDTTSRHLLNAQQVEE